MSATANRTVIERAFKKLGFEQVPSTTLEGLQKLYRAWCLNASFDNIRKMIAMNSCPANFLLPAGEISDSARTEGALPGIDADDFLEAWLEHGVGGTCWPITNALYTLLKAAGFDAIRATGSMWDLGIDNHGTIIVRIDGKDWLTDAGLFTMKPLPLVSGEVFISDEPIFHSEIDPEGDGFFLWSVHPPLPHLLPCHLMDRDVSHEVFAANYERSRGTMSPFNAKLYARRAFPDHLRVLAGNRLFEVRHAQAGAGDGGAGYLNNPSLQMKATILTGDQLLDEMRGPFGCSKQIVDEWVQSGAFDATMTPSEPPPKPPLTRTPPSER